MFQDNLVFFREFISEFQTTGTAFPTSRYAAEALTAPMRESGVPHQILELGPGTGSVTVKILEEMKPEDRLTICEINPRFMETLKKRLSTNEDYLRHKDRVQFFLGPAQDIQEDTQYDLIVCALPFLNFDIDTVKEIFDKLKRISTDNTVMTYYEYIGLRKLAKSSVAPPLMRKRVLELDAFLKCLYRELSMRKKRVWRNMLPVNVYTLHFVA